LNIKNIKPVTLKELLIRDFPKKEYFLKPLLFRGSLMMIYASPGIGKTFTALGMGLAAASQGNFLKWKSEVPARTLYVDGEMGDELTQSRLSKLVVSVDYAYKGENFKIICPDDFNNGEIPQISNPAHHGFYLEQARDKDLIIFDNYGCLTTKNGTESDEHVWDRCWGLIKQLKAMKKAIIIVHHAGKGGLQLGTSKKEQPLNWMIELRRPAIYEATEGARFELRFTKIRGVHGEDVESLLVNIKESAHGLAWEWGGLDDELEERIAQMKEVGMSDTQIALEVGKPLFFIKSTLKKSKNEFSCRGDNYDNDDTKDEQELF